jgi:hypothetical protein
MQQREGERERERETCGMEDITQLSNLNKSAAHVTMGWTYNSNRQPVNTLRNITGKQPSKRLFGLLRQW